MGYIYNNNNGVYKPTFTFHFHVLRPCPHGQLGAIEFRKCIWWYKSAQKFTGTKMANSNCYHCQNHQRSWWQLQHVRWCLLSWSDIFLSCGGKRCMWSQVRQELWGTWSSKSIALALVPPWSCEKLILPQSWIHRDDIVTLSDTANRANTQYYYEGPAQTMTAIFRLLIFDGQKMPKLNCKIWAPAGWDKILLTRLHGYRSKFKTLRPQTHVKLGSENPKSHTLSPLPPEVQLLFVPMDSIFQSFPMGH